MMPLLNRLLRYGLVGGTAAAVHISVLLLLGPWMSLSLANPIAFLAASIAGYLGHALLTFREETGGASSPVAGCCCSTWSTSVSAPSYRCSRPRPWCWCSHPRC